MEYIDKINKINTIAKSLKDNGLVSNMDEAVRMAEKMIEDESIHSLSEQSKNAGPEPAAKKEDKTEEPEEKEPIKEDVMKESETEQKEITEKSSEEDIKQPELEIKQPEPLPELNIPEEKKGFFDKIKERFSKKEKVNAEEAEKEPEKPKGFFEKIKEKFKKKDVEGFEEVRSEI